MELPEMTNDSWTLLEMARTGWQWLGIAGMTGNGWKDWKWLELAGNGWTLGGTAENGWK